MCRIEIVDDGYNCVTLLYANRYEIVLINVDFWKMNCPWLTIRSSLPRNEFARRQKRHWGSAHAKDVPMK